MTTDAGRPVILWFRRDLRLQDNPALTHAAETGRPILPVAISYHDASGRHTTAPSFVGEITLIQCLLQILACRTLSVRLTPAAPIATEGRARRELANAAHQVIEVAIKAALDAPPAGN